jgi:hypothetical protein
LFPKRNFPIDPAQNFFLAHGAVIDPVKSQLFILLHRHDLEGVIKFRHNDDFIAGSFDQIENFVKISVKHNPKINLR